MNDLAVLLDQGVPEPEAFLDPEALLRRAHRRRTARLAGGLGGLACIAVAVGVAMLATTSRPPVASGAPPLPTLSSLDRAVALPPDLVSAVGPPSGEPHQPTGLGVLAQQVGTRKLYLAAGTHDGVCLMLRNTDGSGATGCAAIADLLTTPLLLVMDWDDGRPVYTAIVMPDGYTRLTIGSDTATAASNVAYLPAITSTHGVISGPHVQSRKVDLGPRVLPTSRTGTPPLAAPRTGHLSAVASGSAVASLRYPVNAHGMTYGSLADAPTHGGQAPDLVAAVGVDDTGAHVDGYFRHADMPREADPKSPAEASALMARSVSPKTVTLYAVDGTTVVGSFTFDGRAAGTATAAGH